MFYVITYGVTTDRRVRRGDGGGGSHRQRCAAKFPGLSSRAPGLSLCLLIFLLSLGGIPPLAGFIGKFFLFSAAVQRGRQISACSGW